MPRDEIESLDWYYQVELEPGIFTRGRRFPNMQATLALLRRIKLAGLSVLDVGAMEGAFSVLMERAGARVFAYDRMPLDDRIARVKFAYGAEFGYRSGISFHDFARDRIATGAEPFDLILCSGVLYHAIEPLLFLHYLRALLRPGGILVFETAQAVERDALLYFNEAGRFYRQTNYFQPSSGFLDTALRYMGFRILDAVHVERRVSITAGKHIVRGAMTCVLTDQPVAAPQDEWAAQRLMDMELGEYLAPPAHAAQDLSALVSRKRRPREWKHPGTGSLDLTHLYRNQTPIRFNPRACRMRLASRLDDVRPVGELQPA